MSTINDGGPAFPSLAKGVECPGGVQIPMEYGMTLRDYFAAKAMQGLIAQSNGTAMGSYIEDGAQWSYDMADAMLTAREAQS